MNSPEFRERDPLPDNEMLFEGFRDLVRTHGIHQTGDGEVFEKDTYVLDEDLPPEVRKQVSSIGYVPPSDEKDDGNYLVVTLPFEGDVEKYITFYEIEDTVMAQVAYNLTRSEPNPPDDSMSPYERIWASMIEDRSPHPDDLHLLSCVLGILKREFGIE